MMRPEPPAPRPRIRALNSLGVRLPAVAGGLVLLVAALVTAAAYLRSPQTRLRGAALNALEYQGSQPDQVAAT